MMGGVSSRIGRQGQPTEIEANSRRSRYALEGNDTTEAAGDICGAADCQLRWQQVLPVARRRGVAGPYSTQ